MYANSEIAFSGLDFSGLGYVTKEAFLDSIIVKQKIPFTLDQF